MISAGPLFALIFSLMRAFSLVFLILVSCATRYDLPQDYWHQLRRHAGPESKRTVILFLVDGLSLQALRPQLEKGRLPNLQGHFLSGGRQLMTAHSIFPSLTFPNISSLLSGKPVHVTGALGNKVVNQGRLMDFESLSDRNDFGQMIAGNTVFNRLAAKGQRTVSLDYGLGVDATFRSEVIDLKSGLALAGDDYLYLDQKKLDSLKLLLSQENPSQWPEFIFIHLIGVDYLSHSYGAGSRQVADYLVSLDQSMKDVLKLLQGAERKGHETVSLLTADHGFSAKLNKTVDVKKLVSKLGGDLRLINEVRFALVYDAKQPSLMKKRIWAERLLRTGQIEIVSYRHQDEVYILSKLSEVHFKYQKNTFCPEDQSRGVSVEGQAVFCPASLPQNLKNLFYPFFIENLAFFFQAEKHPDLLLIPASDTAFADVKHGYHGGPSSSEVLVPLLMRNAVLHRGSSLPSLSELLRFL